MPPRDDERHDPNERRELEALDAALAGRPVDADHAELAELARAMRDDRERPAPEYAADLDRRVAEGFATGAGELHAVGTQADDAREHDAGAETPRRPAAPRRTRRGRPFAGRALAPALGVAATALLAVIVAVAVLTGNDEPGGGGVDQAPVVRPQELDAPAGDPGEAPARAPEPATPDGGGAPAQDGDASPAPSPRSTAVITTEPGRVAATTRAAGTIAVRNGGAVERLTLPARPDRTAGVIDLRVPRTSLDRALSELEALGPAVVRRGGDPAAGAVERVRVTVEPR